MALKFQVRGTAQDAYYASGFKASSVVHAATASITSSGTSGVFGGNYIDMTNAPQINWSGLDNCPFGTPAFTILMRLVPTFTGTPSGVNGLLILGPLGAANPGGIDIAINGSGQITVIRFNTNDVMVINGVFATAPNWVTGVPIDIWVLSSGTTAAGEMQLWTASNGSSPTMIATLTPAAVALSPSKVTMTSIQTWSQAYNAHNNSAHINELVMWDTVENPASYGTRAGFISASSFEGYSFSDPGVANVRSGTPYTYAGATETGTAHIPAASDVRSGTATDATTGTLDLPVASNVKIGITYDGVSKTGTYDGSDRWTDPGVGNVTSGVAYKANSTSNNRTGTAVVPGAADVRSGVATGGDTGTLAVPSPTLVISGTPTDNTVGTYSIVSASNVKVGVTFGVSGGSTGTYDGSDRWTDPGAGNVRGATPYKANSLTNNRSGTLAVPAPSQVLTGIATDNTTGTYAAPANSDVRQGVTNGPGVGTLDIPQPAVVLQNFVFDGGSKTGTLQIVIGGGGAGAVVSV